MTLLYRIAIRPFISFEAAWNLLEEAGVDILYGSDEEGSVELFVNLPAPDHLPAFDWIAECAPYSLPPIDWEEQWATHGHDFHEGCVHVDLGPGSSTLRLKPGAGFGDLSHPTTRLMLKLLAEVGLDCPVVDIGSGSGILTVAAAAMGAPVAYGIDIDPAAVEHARQNALLNHLESRCSFFLPDEFMWEPVAKAIVVLMNMIWTEQEAAWQALPSLHSQNARMILSGIRKEERGLYLDKMQAKGRRLEKECEEEGWLAFVFSS